MPCNGNTDPSDFSSPLPPDDAGREDIMSAQDEASGAQGPSPLPPEASSREDILSREDAAPGDRGKSPLPPDSPSREDIILGQPRTDKPDGAG